MLLSRYSRAAIRASRVAKPRGVRRPCHRHQATETVDELPYFAEANVHTNYTRAVLPTGDALDSEAVCVQFASRRPGCPTHPGPLFEPMIDRQ